MTLAQMKFLDKYLGWVLCAVLSAVDAIVSIFRRPPSLPGPDEEPKILLVKFWGMGSIVLASPLFTAIRQRYPRASLQFFTLARNRDVVAMFPDVDRVHILDIDRGAVAFLRSLLSTMRTLMASRLDIAMDLEFFTRFSAIVVYLTGARARVGFKAWEKWRGNLHLIGVPFNRYWRVSRNFGNLGSAVGVPLPDEPRLVQPVIPEDQRAAT